MYSMGIVYTIRIEVLGGVTKGLVHWYEHIQNHSLFETDHCRAVNGVEGHHTAPKSENSQQDDSGTNAW